jgi:transcriptional regulator with XRE-family HTH domain
MVCHPVQVEITGLLTKLSKVHHDLHTAHFYQRIYRGIRNLRNFNQINCKQLSNRLNYSPNHFAHMERDNCELTLTQTFEICRALGVSFVKLLIFAHSLDFFTDSKVAFVSLSELHRHYPHIELPHHNFAK